METLQEGITQYTIRLSGIRPIMFDRYPGDNSTKLEPLDKFYLNASGECGLPVLNFFSLLAAQNTPSVGKTFWGKGYKNLCMALMAYINFEATEEDPTMATIYDETGKAYRPDDPRIQVLAHVARTKQSTPNPTMRPIIPKGWCIRLRMDHQDNDMIKPPTIKKMLQQAGTLGLGTFRPIFGRFITEVQEVKA